MSDFKTEDLRAACVIVANARAAKTAEEVDAIDFDLAWSSEEEIIAAMPDVLDALAKAEKERNDLRVLSERLAAGIHTVRHMIDASIGVTGLHGNGDVAPWDELLRGGGFEDWLLAFTDAETAIEDRKAQQNQQAQE